MRRIVAVAVVILTIATACGAVSSNQRSTMPNAAQRGRLVMVSSKMQLSQPGRPLHVRLIAGGASFREQRGVVLSDEQCQADGAGVSRCLNRIRLADGQTISVRHMHRMMDVACLTPGEQVTVRMLGS